MASNGEASASARKRTSENKRVQSASRVRVRSKEGLDASATSPPRKRDQIKFGQPRPLEFPPPEPTRESRGCSSSGLGAITSLHVDEATKISLNSFNSASICSRSFVRSGSSLLTDASVSQGSVGVGE